VIARTLVNVQGPVGGGKTAFIESLLRSEVAPAICVRSERDAKLRRPVESAPRSHPELRRYRRAGAGAAACYRFSAPSIDDFYATRFMEEYSEAVFIEGDSPLELADLTVFVAPPPPEGALLTRELRDGAAENRAEIKRYVRAVKSRQGMVELLGVKYGEPIAGLALASEGILEELRRSIAARLGELRRQPPPTPAERWGVAEGYDAIVRGQLVVLNVREGEDRSAAEACLADVVRLRKDPAISRDVLGRLGSKIPVTAVIADVTDPKNAGLRKAVARVRRALALVRG
jgi:hypothetical protein